MYKITHIVAIAAMLFFFNVTAVIAQSDNTANDKNSRTQILSTGISMVIPENFNQLPDKNSYMSPETFCVIQINLFEDKVYKENEINNYIKEHALEKGLEIIAHRKIALNNGQEATMFTLSKEAEHKGQKVYFEKISLLTGTANKLIWVESLYPLDNKGVVYRELYESLLTLEFDK